MLDYDDLLLYLARPAGGSQGRGDVTAIRLRADRRYQDTNILAGGDCLSVSPPGGE